MLAREQARNLVLRGVRVLELVHHEVDEPLLPPVAHLRRAPEQFDGFPEQIVEVHPTTPSERRLVRGEDAVDDLVVVPVSFRCEGIRPKELRLCPAYRGEY